MRGRGPAVVAGLLAAGVAAGFGASVAADRPPVAAGVPAPVAASPSYPVDPPPVYAEDPDDPPLAASLRLRTAVLAAEGFRYTFPVPDGWDEVPIAFGEAKWVDPAASAPYTYALRVEIVSGQNTVIERVLADRVRDLGLDEEDFEELGRTSDSLTFSYTVDEHLRVGMLRWLDLTGSGFPDVEVSVAGRADDLAGMEALMATVSEGVRRS